MKYRVTTWFETDVEMSKEDARIAMLQSLHMKENASQVNISIEQINPTHEFPRRG